MARVVPDGPVAVEKFLLTQRAAAALG